MNTAVSNVLASRYATVSMQELWSNKGRVILERRFWIAVAKAQQELGLDIPQEAIDAYEAQVESVDLPSIDKRERVTRHDVKARLEEFNALAGHEFIHRGMTSRDLTENVEQLQIFQSIQLLRTQAGAALGKLGKLADQYRNVTISARTHNVAAQPTTLGKRLAMFGEELHRALVRFDQFIETYPLRGLKGAVGSQLDQLSLFEGDQTKVAQLEQAIAKHLGLPDTLQNVGQVYPRSLDFQLLSSFMELAAPATSFATTLRLMAGHELVSEGFAPGQTGSSAMPHKVNSRSCERINGFATILRGYLTMTADLAGNQWNEGDVSCSVVRRVALPDACFALDGLLETLLVVLQQMEVNQAVIAAELEKYLPFLLTTTVLMEAVKSGLGREQAHKRIKEHALAANNALRSGTSTQNDLMQRLAADSEIPLSEEELAQILQRGRSLTGNADTQIDHFLKNVECYLKAHPKAQAYTPGSIL